MIMWNLCYYVSITVLVINGKGRSAAALLNYEMKLQRKVTLCNNKIDLKLKLERIYTEFPTAVLTIVLQTM